MDSNWSFCLPIFYIRLKIMGCLYNTQIFYDLFNCINYYFGILRFLVDKFTSRKLIFYINIPLLCGLLILYSFDQPFISFIFFGLVGVSNGLANVLGSSTWAEIYGVRHIGGIKALTTALMVFQLHLELQFLVILLILV